MNYFSTLLAATLLASSLTACDKDSAEPLLEEPQAEFYVQARQNDNVWLKTGVTGVYGNYYKSKRTFFVTGADPQSIGIVEKLTLSFSMPKRQLLSSIQALPATWLEIGGGDMIFNQFMSTTAQGLPTIQVTQLDTINRIIEGRFEATLQRDDFYTKQVELKRFKSGTFRVQYYEHD
ncbi:hypothetical protein [Hymenobacter profundi]|uniref:DUF4840 domain-containing protein n=1 Tax=Hymenobacter profundi TaxID=1982110 RepID=A0ABS6X064_9BACT|nr:hypothetical protein [Hymenobacter profundi]MBW3129228.1 hypothetical protein [Hymenobacter profundi]